MQSRYPQDLALPAAVGAETVRRLAKAWLLRTWRAFLALELPDQPDGPTWREVRELAVLQTKTSPANLYAWLLRPTAAMLVKTATLDPWLPLQVRVYAAYSACLLLGIEAAAQGWLTRPLAWTGRLPPGASLLLGLAWAEQAGPLILANGQVPTLGANEAFYPIHPAYPQLRLALADVNPLPVFAEHPSRRGNVVGLGGAPLPQWMAGMREALDIIDTYLPEVADEMRVLLGQLLPAGVDGETHQSASYLQAPGSVYLTLHPDPMTLAEAIIHEFQHNKLNLLLDADPLLHGDEARYPSPLRPDARPLRGVLLAVHAFQPVAVLYERMAGGSHVAAKKHDFGKRFDQILARNRDGWAVLRRHARPTELGRALLADMARVEGRFANRVGADPDSPNDFNE